MSLKTQNNKKEEKINLEEIKDNEIKEIKNLIKEEKNEIKDEKMNNFGNIISKYFPINNIIVSRGIDGHLNIYDYYSGEITKYFSLSCPIENINSINKNNTIIYSSNIPLFFLIYLKPKIFRLFMPMKPQY